MTRTALSIDLYQISTLLVQISNGLLDFDKDYSMNFFFRKLPKNRNYVVTAGLSSILKYCELIFFFGQNLSVIRQHPVLKHTMGSYAGKRLIQHLANIKCFVGEIEALPEGTLAFAGPAYDISNRRIYINGTALNAYTPIIQMKSNLLFAKLLETPILSRLNHMSMVASKAARVVSEAKGKPVFEFGQRRTHHDAAIDASYAAHIGGCTATSNLAATAIYNIPSVGTMDHFAIQAAEIPNVSVEETERAFFSDLYKFFADATTLLVDTYDVKTGILNAVKVFQGKPGSIRIDSNISVETIKFARHLLNENGANNIKIIVSDGLDEYKIRELAGSEVDGFGVGENIVCSPDSSTGIGAVGKLVKNGYGKPTMKISSGSGKMTLPGPLQAYRFEDYDFLSLKDEPAPMGGVPLLIPVWKDTKPQEQPSIEEIRGFVQDQISNLPDHLRSLEISENPRRFIISNKLVEMIKALSHKE